MENKVTVLLAAVVLMTTSTPSFAREGGDREPLSWSRSKTEWKPEIVNYEGLVRCKEKPEDSATTCDMEFVRNDGETFDLEDSPALVSLHCQNHNRDLKVNLEAEKTPRFLFWGGNLITKHFQVTGEVPAKDDLGSREPASREPVSTREPTLRGKAAL